MVEQLPDGIKRSLKDKLMKKKVTIAEMVHKDSENLDDKTIVYSRKLTGEKENGKEGDRITAFVVKGYESCILIQLGRTVGLLPEGFYEIDKNFQFSGTEIVWIDITEFRTKWGLSNLYLKDNFKIAAHGILLVKISDPRKFFLNVVSGKKLVDKEDVDKFIFDFVVQTYREVLGECTVQEVMKNREDIKQKVQAKLYDLLDHWGISLINLEIIGLKLPEKFEKLSDLAIDKQIQKEKLSTEREALEQNLEMDSLKDTVASRKKERKLDEELQLMDKKKKLAKKEIELTSIEKTFDREQSILDAQTDYEKTKYEILTEKGLGDVKTDLLGKQEEAKVSGDARMLKLNTEKDITLAKIGAEKDVKIARAKAKMDDEDELQKKGLEKKRKEVKKEIAKLKEKLDKFDDLFAEGKISEDTYKLRINRIEKELKDLEEKLND